MTDPNPSFPKLKEDRIDRVPIFLMEQIIRKYRKLAEQALKDLKTNISLDQWILLKQISEANGTSQVDIAQSTVKDAPTTTRIIDQLTNKNLVVKQLDPEDRRKYMVFVTEKGTELINRILPQVKEYRKIPFDGLTTPDKKLLTSLLKRIDDNLT